MATIFQSILLSLLTISGRPGCLPQKNIRYTVLFSQGFLRVGAFAAFIGVTSNHIVYNHKIEIVIFIYRGQEFRGYFPQVR
ncbi:hypothetical protein B0H21DRAFT_167029 [Amylocystis lapponica]|nr:hypothetical protein B0H21DRAFT_167029 [Amylocystis lapponica]